MLHAVDRIRRTYTLICAVFALGYGLYAGFNSTFLVQRMRAVGHQGEVPIFGDVLLVILAAMVFEVILTPFGGYFADRYGRVRAFIFATALMSMCGLLYAIAGTSAVLAYGEKGILTLAVLAELALAAGFSLRSGSLEAWVTDALDSVGFGHLRAQIYARQWQVFSLGITVGGAASLAYAGYENDILKFDLRNSFGVLPWLGSSGLLLLAGTIAFATMESEEVKGPALGVEPTVPADHPVSFADALRRILSWRDARRVLLLSALLYTSFLVFLYLNPVIFRNAPLGIRGRRFLQDYYFAIFLALGLLRILGPSFAGTLRSRTTPKVLLRRLGIAHGAAMVVGGILGLVTARVPSGGMVACTIVALYSAKFLEEAIKPIRSEAVNAIVVDPRLRALVLSMSTPVGAGLMLLLCIVAQFTRSILGSGIVGTSTQVPVDIWTLCSLGFCAGGVLIVVATSMLEPAQGEGEQRGKDVA